MATVTGLFLALALTLAGCEMPPDGPPCPEACLWSAFSYVEQRGGYFAAIKLCDPTCARAAWGPGWTAAP